MSFGIRTFLTLTAPYINHSLIYVGSLIDPKYFKEYRCKSCGKLLGKGFLSHKESVLEVKCRGCGLLTRLQGEDAQILERRSELLKQGLLPDTDGDNSS